MRTYNKTEDKSFSGFDIQADTHKKFDHLYRGMRYLNQIKPSLYDQETDVEEHSYGEVPIIEW